MPAPAASPNLEQQATQRLREFYTRAPEEELTQPEWQVVHEAEHCTYLNRRCVKIRKSDPTVTIGSCTVQYGGEGVIICPHRFLQKRQIFLDTVHLLGRHEPGNQLHVVPEVSIPSGNVDYFVISAKHGKVQDYLAIEIQAVDTTGKVWPARQRFVHEYIDPDVTVPLGHYGMNWFMTAKTIMIQLHHKAETLELLHKKLVVVVQDNLYRYMNQKLDTSVVREANAADTVQFHVYTLHSAPQAPLLLELAARYSTTPEGIAVMLGAKKSAFIAEADLLARLEPRLGDRTLLTI